MRHWTGNEPRMPGVETDITPAEALSDGVCCLERFWTDECSCEGAAREDDNAA